MHIVSYPSCKSQAVSNDTNGLFVKLLNVSMASYKFQHRFCSIMKFRDHQRISNLKLNSFRNKNIGLITLKLIFCSFHLLKFVNISEYEITLLEQIYISLPKLQAI